MKSAVLFIISILMTSSLFAQNVGINSDGSIPDVSAMLDVKSTNTGLLIPRVNIVNLNTAAPITAPTTSLLVYNTNITTGPGYFYWNGTAWIELLGSDRAWKLDGNAILSGDFLGTTNAQDLVFKTNNTERMIIKSGGNVGIGTINPIDKLQITGSDTYVNIGTNDVYQGSMRLYGKSSGFPGGEIDLYLGNDYDTIPQYQFYFIDIYKDYLRLCRAGESYDFTMHKNGHIRIGAPIISPATEPNPEKILEVNDEDNGGIGLDYKNAIWFRNEAEDDWIRGLTVHGVSANTDDIYVGSGSNPIETNLHFDTGSLVDAIFIKGSSGNVGVGNITDPTEVLEVNGSIKIRENINARLKLGYADNSSAEGGQIDYQGGFNTSSVQYANWVTDVQSNDFRIFSLYSNATSTVQIFNYGTGYVANLEVQGSTTANSFITSSDSRIKTEQEDLDYGLKTIMNIKPKRYNKHVSHFIDNKLVLTDNSTESIGLIAQELYKIVPEVVSKPSDENNELWGVKYSKIVPILVKAMQEQQEIIEAQSKSIEELQELINKLLEENK